MAKGGDLRGELDKALSGNFEFKGNFYHHSTHPVAPNPALAIEGIGLVGLPLSDRDANLILSLVENASGGKAAKDVSEVPVSKVAIQNPRWNEFVNDLASTVVCQDLGVPSSKPRLELQKLLLYRARSKYALQEKSPGNGAFATVTVFLPSAAEGGQVELSVGSQKEAINLSQDSLVNTSVLAYYAGVVQKVKPIKSGYRLALSYSLIHTQSPPPKLPDMHGAVTALRRVLENWKNGSLVAPSPPFVVYFLSNKYDQSDRERGLRGLKGSDIHKVSHLLPIAKELSFTVCLARLTLSLFGYADTCAKYYHRTRPWGYQGNDSEEDNIPDMQSIDEETQEISELTCISGKNKPPFDNFEVDDDVLILKEPLSKQEPDRKEYDDGVVDHLYDRSVLVLYRKEDETKILLSIKGIDWGFKELESGSNRFTAHAREVAFAVLGELQDLAKQNHQSKAEVQSNLEKAVTLLAHAMRWKAAELWNKTLILCERSLETFGKEVSKALQVFSFQAIQPAISGIIGRVSKLQQRYNIIKTIVSSAGTNATPEWIAALKIRALSSYYAAVCEDVPYLVAFMPPPAILVNIQNIIIPNLSGRLGTYQFFLVLTKAIQQHRASFAPSTEGSNGVNSGNMASIGEVLRRTALATIQQWELTLSTPIEHLSASVGASQAQALSCSANMVADSVCELIELCFTIQDLALTTDVINAVYRIKQHLGIVERLKEVYMPIVPRLVAVLQKVKSDFQVRVSDEPFKSFFKTVFSQYLAHVLGSKSTVPRLAPKTIGCGCEHCTVLDTFINNTTSEACFKLLIAQRNHLEERLRLGNVADRVTDQTDKRGQPHTLVISKRPEVLAVYTWEGRRSAAITLLRAVGDDNVLMAVMEERYTDVVDAIEGRRVFSEVKTARDDTMTGISEAGPSISSASSGGPGPMAATTTTLAGMKRKRQSTPRNVIDVIDLT